MVVEIVKCLVARMGHVINKLLLFLSHYSMQYQLTCSKGFKANYNQYKKVELDDLIINIRFFDCFNHFISLVYGPSKNIGIWNYKQLTNQSSVEIYCDEFDCIMVSNPVRQCVTIDFKARFNDFFHVYLFALLNLGLTGYMLTLELYNDDLNCLNLINVFQSNSITSFIYQCSDDSIVMFTMVNGFTCHPVRFPLLKHDDITRLIFDEIVRQLNGDEECDEECEEEYEECDEEESEEESEEEEYESEEEDE